MRIDTMKPINMFWGTPVNPVQTADECRRLSHTYTSCDQPGMGVVLCRDACIGERGENYSRDGQCDDGGPDSDFSICPRFRLR